MSTYADETLLTPANCERYLSETLKDFEKGRYATKKKPGQLFFYTKQNRKNDSLQIQSGSDNDTESFLIPNYKL